MPGLGESEEGGGRSTNEHDKVLFPKGALSLREETIMHTNHAHEGQNNEGYNEGRLILVGLWVVGRLRM